MTKTFCDICGVEIQKHDIWEITAQHSGPYNLLCRTHDLCPKCYYNIFLKEKEDNG